MNRDAGLSDLLPFAHFVGEGVLLNKDGALQVTYQYRGPDGDSATTEERDHLSALFHRMLMGLDDGWMLHVDTLRIPSQDYAAQGYFPDPVSLLIDEERREHYQRLGHHFENIQCLTWVWKFPLPLVHSKRKWFVSGLPEPEEETSLQQYQEQFEATISHCIGLLQTHWHWQRLSSKDVLAYLNTCITGDLLSIAVPPQGCYVDVALARHPICGGYLPKIGQKNIVTVSILGYLNDETLPGLLDHLGTYPLIYRWSNRFIVLSEVSAAKEIKRHERYWHNKVKGFSGMVKEAFLGKESEAINGDAWNMEQHVFEAATLNAQGGSRFGYWTSTVVFMHENESILNDAVASLTHFIEQMGFSCSREDVNALDAWLGTIPGNGSRNVRRMLMSSWNVSHVLPLTSIWTGEEDSAPTSLLPNHAPPVFYAATTGKTPFRFHMDVSDVGHQLLIGPTGSGKSTWLGLLITQFLRYDNAHIFIFDKDYSHQALTCALGGAHVDLGDIGAPVFCPLQEIDSSYQFARAGVWVELLLECQQVSVLPEHKEILHQALELLRCGTQRSLSILCGLIQDITLRSALRYYTIDGTCALLDAADTLSSTAAVHTFEIGGLLSHKPALYLPVLHYLFQHIEDVVEARASLFPTLIILEEAWLYVQHPVFAQKLREWLKTLRKKNARVVFASQSLTDLYDPSTKRLTEVTATLLESCPTKVYCPHPTLDQEMQSLYQHLGMNARQIEILQHIAQPKRDYYVVTPQGQRLIELGLEHLPIARAFIGLSKRESQRLITCQHTYGKDWLTHWLESQALGNSLVESHESVVRRAA